MRGTRGESVCQELTESERGGGPCSRALKLRMDGKKSNRDPGSKVEPDNKGAGIYGTKKEPIRTRPKKENKTGSEKAGGRREGGRPVTNIQLSNGNPTA